MADRFLICHAITAKWEGGWSNHKADPGGKTMYGITEAVYHAWLRTKGRASSRCRSKRSCAAAAHELRRIVANPTT